MRRLPIVAGVFVAAALFAAACGGTSPTVPPVPTVPPIPSIAIPSLPAIPPIAIPSIQIPNGSFSLPSFAIPSFAGDPALAAKFPTTIGGQPVSTPETGLYVDLIAAFGGGNEATARFIQAMQQMGVDPNTVAFGDARVTLNSDDNISAIRAPGTSASQFVAVLPQLQQFVNPGSEVPTVGQVSIAGKTVTTLTDSDENVTYFWPSGDTLWETDASDPSDLNAIFTALQ